MSSRILAFALFPVLALIFLLSVSQSALALPENGQKFKDWTARCEINPNDPADKQCVVFQTVFETNQQKNIMNVVVAFPPNQDVGRIVVILPLGIDLRSGIEFSVDDGDPTRHPFFLCLQDGCQSHIPLEADRLAAFKKGDKGTVVFRALPTLRDVKVPISFAGFTAAVDSLQ